LRVRVSIVAFLMFAAMAATAAVLLTGIFGFLWGGAFNEKYGNKLMRGLFRPSGGRGDGRLRDGDADADLHARG
jgi:hypothetical protein